jgi:hypothetical protein
VAAVSVFDAFDDDALEAADDELPAGEVTRHGKHGHGKIAKRDQPQKVWHWWARRASSLGAPLDDLFKVHQWQMRLLALGYVRHPDLLALAGSLPDITAGVPRGWRPDLGSDTEAREKEWQKSLSPYKRDLERINQTALDRMGATAKANRGTALHGYHERLINGDTSLHAPSDIAAGLERLGDLLRNFTIHTAEQFVVFEDAEPPEGQCRIPSCGTFDWLCSPLPGQIMFAPDGTVITAAARLIGDTKSGDQDVQKPSYLCQPVPYVRGLPYDHALNEERRAAGDNGLRDWPDEIRPNQRWALIAHVPLSRLDDAGLYWVDVDRGEHWARAAQTLREMTREASRTAKKHFYAADGPIPDVEQVEPAPLNSAAAEPVALATVTSLPVEKLLAECKRLEDIDAVYLANRSRWSAELGVAAREQAEKIERGGTG